MKSLPRWFPLAAVSALALALAACSPVAILNATLPSGTHREMRDVAYGPDARQRLDVYRPTSAPPADGYPVVLFFYGGSWNRGERADYRFVGEALASRGIVALIADYRLYPQVSYPDFLVDSATAMAFTFDHAAQYGGDPKRVFVAGHSAGGYNAAMVALDPRWLAQQQHSPQELAGWIGLAGPYDFLPTSVKEVEPVFHAPNYPVGSQPVDYAESTSPRSFLGAARKDSFVDPVRNSEQLFAKLQAAGAPVTLKLYDHVNHMTLAGAFARPLRFLAPVLDDVVAFIQSTPPAH